MKKIPTIYVRDFAGTLGPAGRFVTRHPHPDCAWVFDGEGVPTRKLDGTCCLIRDGKLYRRHEVKTDKRTGRLKHAPLLFDEIERDPETGHLVGWVPIDPTAAADQYHVVAFARALKVRDGIVPDGTYELVGPHINGNPEEVDLDVLVSHDGPGLRFSSTFVPTEYDALRDWLAEQHIEGVVWHHPDGRMAKIKGRDFGIQR